MKCLSTPAMLFILVLSSLALLSFTNNDWSLEKNKSGIKVYTRSVAGKSIKEFKAVSVINCNIQELERILDDIPNYPKWQKECLYIEVLEQNSPDEMYTYFEIDMPFPLSNRDMITHIKKKRTNDGKIIFYNESAPDFYPLQDGKVRMQESEGKWELTPISSTQTELVYQFYGEPGSIPAWVVNAFIVDSPYRTLTNLKARAEH